MAPSASATDASNPAADMIQVPGGTFRMGSDHHYPEEKPAHTATVDGFWMDTTPVTNAQFRKFIEATGHVTWAEIDSDPKDYPGARPEMLKAGGLVFTPPSKPVDLADWSQWWRFTFGATWQRPYGKGSHIGGLDGAEFAWGAEMLPGGKHMANTWQGSFPHNNTRDDGFARTSPVKTCPANGYGLYDMIGNVWEWTTDWFSAQHEGDATEACCVRENPRGGSVEGSFSSRQPNVCIPRKVLKGGSHLCAPSYCRRYRPAARHAEDVDTTTSHVGFRCIVREQRRDT